MRGREAKTAGRRGAAAAEHAEQGTQRPSCALVDDARPYSHDLYHPSQQEGLRGMTRQDSANSLYSGGGGMPGLVRDSKEAVFEHRARINVVLLYSREDPARELAEWTPSDRRPGVARRGGRLVLTLTKHGEETIRITIAESDRRPNVYYAVSDCPAADFRGRFVSLIDRHVPTLSRIYISSTQIRNIVEAVSSSNEVDVRFMSRRSQRSSRPGFDSRTDHVEKNVEEFFAGAGRGGEIGTIKLACTPRGLVESSAAAGKDIVTMSRDCRFSTKHGARVLFDTILPLAEDAAVRRSEMLRASAETASRPVPEPLIVRFSRKVFADPKKNAAHVAAIAAMPYTATNEHHVNPYIHLSMVDYMDCSSYDIWVLVSDRLAIIPQFSATDASMGRLVNHITKKFGDATIEKYDGGGRGGK